MQGYSAKDVWDEASSCSRCSISLDAFPPDTTLNVFPCGHIVCHNCWLALYSPRMPRRQCKLCPCYILRPEHRYDCGHQIPRICYPPRVRPAVEPTWFLRDGQQIGQSCQRCVMVNMLRSYTSTVRSSGGMGQYGAAAEFAYACLQGGPDGEELHGLEDRDAEIESWDSVLPELAGRAAELTVFLRQTAGHLATEPSFAHAGEEGLTVVFRNRFGELLDTKIWEDQMAAAAAAADAAGF